MPPMNGTKAMKYQNPDLSWSCRRRMVSDRLKRNEATAAARYSRMLTIEAWTAAKMTARINTPTQPISSARANHQ